MVDGLPDPRDLLLPLLLGAEEGGRSRDGDATTKDGEGDDAGDEAEGGPEHVLDWVQVVGGLLLVLVPPSPVKGQLFAEDDGGLPPHAHGGDGDCLALVKQAVALLTVEPEDAGQTVPHCILGTLKNFLHTHLMAAMLLFVKVLVMKVKIQIITLIDKATSLKAGEHRAWLLHKNSSGSSKPKIADDSMDDAEDDEEEGGAEEEDEGDVKVG